MKKENIKKHLKRVIAIAAIVWIINKSTGTLLNEKPRKDTIHHESKGSN